MTTFAPSPTQSLFQMVQSMRPHGSLQEAKFIEQWLIPLEMQEDTFGNLYKWIGDSKVCWTAHLDTVHLCGGTQIVVREANRIQLAKQSTSNCLGGDDTAGVWLLHEMIKANKPGFYLFHRGEERGCLGSGFIVEKNPRAMTGIKAVISLDRRSTKSIITYQRSQRCCSDKFGQSLASALGMKHELDQGGLFTDSAKYTDLVSECTNVSVGFDHEHSKREYIDSDYLTALRERLIALDESKLIFVRKPGTVEYKTYRSNDDNWDGMYGGYSEYRRTFRGARDQLDAYYRRTYCGGRMEKGRWIKMTEEEWEIWTERKKKPALKVISNPFAELIQENLLLTVRMLESWGFDTKQFQDMLTIHKLEEDSEKK